MQKPRKTPKRPKNCLKPLKPQNEEGEPLIHRKNGGAEIYRQNGTMEALLT